MTENKKSNIIKINARGKIIEIFRHILEKSPVFKEYPDIDKLDEFTIPFKEDVVHLFIDYLSGYDIGDHTQLKDICKYMGVEWKGTNEKKGDTYEIIQTLYYGGDDEKSVICYIKYKGITIIIEFIFYKDCHHVLQKRIIFKSIDKRYDLSTVDIAIDFKFDPTPCDCGCLNSYRCKSKCKSEAMRKFIITKAVPLIIKILN